MIFLVGLNVFLDYLGFLSTAEANVVAIFETLRNSVLSLFKKQQTFNFNMGHGILYSSYKEAAKVLMRRNMPEVLDNTQKQVNLTTSKMKFVALLEKIRVCLNLYEK